MREGRSLTIKGRGGNTTLTLKFGKLGKESHVSTRSGSLSAGLQMAPEIRSIPRWGAEEGRTKLEQILWNLMPVDTGDHNRWCRVLVLPRLVWAMIVRKWPAAFLAHVGTQNMLIPFFPFPVNGRVCSIYCEYHSAINLISFYSYSFQE